MRRRAKPTNYQVLVFFRLFVVSQLPLSTLAIVDNDMCWCKFPASSMNNSIRYTWRNSSSLQFLFPFSTHQAKLLWTGVATDICRLGIRQGAYVVTGSKVRSWCLFAPTSCLFVCEGMHDLKFGRKKEKKKDFFPPKFASNKSSSFLTLLNQIIRKISPLRFVFSLTTVWVAKNLMIDRPDRSIRSAPISIPLSVISVEWYPSNKKKLKRRFFLFYLST